MIGRLAFVVDVLSNIIKKSELMQNNSESGGMQKAFILSHDGTAWPPFT